MLEPSPFAPESLPKMPAIKGVTLATCHTGMRYQERDDLLLVTFAEGTTVAGVFTTNSIVGAPVEWCRKILPHGKARALVVNAGVANVFNGKAGENITQETATSAANLFQCPEEEIYLASTGTIGDEFEIHYITDNLLLLKENATNDQWHQAAKAITTTDTFPKLVTAITEIEGKKVTINGFIKGSGMVMPNMATMLGYIMTDASLPASVLQSLLNEFVDDSFHSITVDSDTSTSDTVQLFATQQVDHTAVSGANDPTLAAFKQTLRQVMIQLAQLVVKDGEGISKFVTINVSGAKSDESARVIALSVANSPLVKTAIAGEDANWGRIVMAIGKSREPIDKDHVSIAIGSTTIASAGARNSHYIEAPVAEYMKGNEITVNISVGYGQGQSTVWTSDLTHGYISINADYRS